VLSSVEAVAATMYILGEVEEAERYLSLYKWGGTLLTLNADPLEAYAKARTEGGVLKAERQFFPTLFEFEPR